jgi:hypothetical protein
MSLVKKIEALKMASNIGCNGAHKDENGNWMPCSSHAEMMEISNRAEPKKGKSLSSRRGMKKTRILTGVKKRRNNWEELEKEKNKEWETLGQRGVISIDAVPGMGIVSGKSLNTKASLVGPQYVRDNDPDVFIDPESARFRSRQLGCIGISRRISKTGRSVWMPCTNMSDYARLAGTTSLGRRHQRRDFENAVRTVLNTESRKLRRKVSIFEELHKSR